MNSSLTLPNDPDGEKEFFEFLGHMMNVTPEDARKIFVDELGNYDERGERIK